MKIAGTDRIIHAACSFSYCMCTVNLNVMNCFFTLDILDLGQGQGCKVLAAHTHPSWGSRTPTPLRVVFLSKLQCTWMVRVINSVKNSLQHKGEAKQASETKIKFYHPLLPLLLQSMGFLFREGKRPEWGGKRRKSKRPTGTGAACGVSSLVKFKLMHDFNLIVFYKRFHDSMLVAFH